MNKYVSDLSLINRKTPIFQEDYRNYEGELKRILGESRVLVVGGAGSIGSTVVGMLFDFSPKSLHVLDLNENGLADLVRNIRSSAGYTTENFRTICFDPLDSNANSYIEKMGPYDIIFNFAAVKHVRSEKDPFTLSRMLHVNLHLMRRLSIWADMCRAHTLFSVSTDKAANPANLMGASKRLMEMIGFCYGNGHFSTARFANVAFSNGSLLKAFYDRLSLNQPLSAPSNIKRFFITHEEAARLCLLEAIIGRKQTIAIPRAPGEVELTSFVDVAENILEAQGLRPLLCSSEEEARAIKPNSKVWPCYFFESDTSGEKPFEEFVAINERIGQSCFNEISLIDKIDIPEIGKIDQIFSLDPLKAAKEDVVDIIADIVPGFEHIEKGRNLDERM